MAEPVFRIVKQTHGKPHQSNTHPWDPKPRQVKEGEMKSGPVRVLVKNGKPVTAKGAWLLGLTPEDQSPIS